MIRVALSLVWLFLLVGAPAYAEMGEDGLHKQPWFSETFGDIKEDMQTARDEGKRLALIFEQRGCSYCKKLHETVFSDKEVSDYISENYMVVQYNLYGAKEITDLDGEALTEKAAAKRWRILYTPTVLFLPEADGDSTTVREASVATMPGAFQKGTVLDMLRWVREKGYERDETFQEYHAKMVAKRQK